MDCPTLYNSPSRTGSLDLGALRLLARAASFFMHTSTSAGFFFQLLSVGCFQSAGGGGGAPDVLPASSSSPC